MNTVKNVTVAIDLSVLSVGYAQAAEAVKALAGRELPHDEGLWTVALWVEMIRAVLLCVGTLGEGAERKGLRTTIDRHGRPSQSARE